MKKSFSITLSILLCFLAAAAIADHDATHDAFFLREGNTLVQALAVIAGSDYPEIATSSSLFVEEDPFSVIMSIIGQLPEEVRMFSVDSDVLISILNILLKMENAASMDFPPEVEEYMLRPRMLSMVLSMFNANVGSNHLVLSSILTTGKSFVSPFEPFAPTLAVFLYPDHPYAYAVIFTETGVGVVSASCVILPRDMAGGFLALETSPGQAAGAMSALMNPNANVADMIPFILMEQTRYLADAFAGMLEE